MTGFVLLLSILVQPGQPSIQGSGPPIAHEHVMDESDVDSLTAALQPFETVFVAAIDGVPAPRAERESFLRGFHDAFGEKSLRTERMRKGASQAVPDESLPNRMRLVAEEEGARWAARIGIAWLAPPADSAGAGASDSIARAWPGLRAAVRVRLSPSAGRGGETGVRTIEFEYRLRFPSGHPVDASYYQLAGRQVAFLALEALQRPEGRLDDDQRLILEDTLREPAPSSR
ncbi:MAG TPA: hypothetical protein VMS88_05750 [Terriglobales bacterium]|nr:hypothetical protein [Terriglobales bacterium]